MPPSRSIRLDAELVDAAETHGKALHRSTPRQLEFWASIGRQLSSMLPEKDLIAISQGLARINIEPAPSSRVNPDDIFTAVGQERNKPFVSSATNPASFQYESSQTPGYIDRVDIDGNRITGKMIKGQFVPK